MLPTTSAVYTGVDLDDFDHERDRTESQSTHRSRLSIFSLLKHNAGSRGFKTWRTSSMHLRSVGMKTFWTQLCSQTKLFLFSVFANVKTVDCRHDIYRFITIVLPLLCITGLTVIFPIITASRLWTANSACQPDSGFYVGYGQYNIWNPSGFFQITLGFGDLSFTLAKAIDVGWDVSLS
jgi:hypothetical protein